MRNWSYITAVLALAAVTVWITQIASGPTSAEDATAQVATAEPAVTVAVSGTNKYSDFAKPSPEELKKKLTEAQFYVTQKDGTERPFQNEYWDNKRPGIYVDVVSGEPLFSSTDKYKSGTGWPSFTRPISEDAMVTREDTKLFITRTELRSRHADSHLGHLFEDGPPPTGLRYCINSAALRFVPREDLEKEGYGKFARLFEEN